MRKLSACLTAAILTFAATSASAGPDRTDPWQRFDRIEWSTSQGRLGVMVMSMTSELRTFFAAPSERGVLVVKVESASPAAAAGIKVGDVLTHVRGEAIDDAGDVISALSGTKQGDKIKIELVRDKRPMTIDATMSSTVSSLEWLKNTFPWLGNWMRSTTS